MYKPLFLLFLLFPLFTLAQENESFLISGKVKQGSIMVGGNAAGYFNRISDDLGTRAYKANKMVLDVQAKNGYFIRHDWAIGLDVTLHHENQSITSDSVRTPFRETYLLFGPFTRVYLVSAFFGELSVKVGLHNFSGGPKNDLIASNLGFGYSFFINQQLSVEPLLSFRYSREINRGNYRTTLGPMIGVGVQAYLLRQRSHIIKRGL